MRHMDVVIDVSDMLARFGSRSVTGRFRRCIVWAQPFVVSSCVCFIRLTASGWLEESFLAPKRYQHKTGHVERGARGSDCADKPNNPTYRDVRGRSSVPKNFVFRPKATERDDSADCEPSRKKGHVGDGHVLLQAAHTAHVLFVMHAVNDTARSQENEGFEECMRHHVKDADDKCAHTASHEHESQLRYSRIRKHFLYVVLRDADCRSENRRRRTN